MKMEICALPRCFVTGATGVVGPPLIRTLCDDGWQVTTLVRQNPQPGLLPELVKVMQGDLSNPHILREGSRSADVVFHLAGMLHINNPPESLASVYQQINVDGTRRVIESAQ